MSDLKTYFAAPGRAETPSAPRGAWAERSSATRGAMTADSIFT